MTVVDAIYTDFQDAVGILARANEVSLQIMLESNFRKTLLLCAASHFEHILSIAVEEFAVEAAAGNDLIGSLVRTKVISRQYHTWFDWEGNNANRFFSLFGVKFREHMLARIKETEGLDVSVRAFIEIGRDRNQLVHTNYASFLMNKTPREIYELYLSAHKFVDIVGNELRLCSDMPIKA